MHTKYDIGDTVFVVNEKRTGGFQGKVEEIQIRSNGLILYYVTTLAGGLSYPENEVFKMTFNAKLFCLEFHDNEHHRIRKDVIEEWNLIQEKIESEVI